MVGVGVGVGRHVLEGVEGMLRRPWALGKAWFMRVRGTESLIKERKKAGGNDARKLEGSQRQTSSPLFVLSRPNLASGLQRHVILTSSCFFLVSLRAYEGDAAPFRIRSQALPGH